MTQRRQTGMRTWALVFAVSFIFFLAVPCAVSIPSPPRSPDGSVRIPASGTAPQLVFASDTATEKLGGLFTPSVIAELKDLHAGVALAISEFSPQRAELVRRLTDAGVPVTAWLVLPKEQGYYFNVSNAAEAFIRYQEFQAWTAEQKLHWAAAGFDIEPKLDELQGSKGHMIWTLLRRAFEGRRVEQADRAYASLIRKMRGDGYTVQTYQLLFLCDERRAHSSLLQRTLGLVDVRGDDEVMMLYTSFNHKAGAAMIWGYGPDSQTIAVGSTALSGVADFDTHYPPLNWDEFSRDLLVASHYSPRMVGIYSLEGCVQQGFLPKLKTLRWDQTVTIPANQVKGITHFRHFARGALWVGSHLGWVVLAVIVAIAGFVWRRRSLRAARQASSQSAAA